jgi:hypothetical protein
MGILLASVRTGFDIEITSLAAGCQWEGRAALVRLDQVRMHAAIHQSDVWRHLFTTFSM